MTVHVDGKSLKQFHAKNPITKAPYARTCSSATSKTAARFLGEVRRHMPIRSARVAGGAEFMRDFEAAREAENIPLNVPPPRRPDLNGHVGRSNRAPRTEFRSVYRGELTVAAINRALGT